MSLSMKLNCINTFPKELVHSSKIHIRDFHNLPLETHYGIPVTSSTWSKGMDQTM